ncbi:MAG: glycosyltransferase, partial [Sphingobacteriales bacterium]
DEVTLFYKAIDVMLMPTLGETYGMVTLEAMLMKKPVLGLGLEGTAALLEGGSLGWLYGMDNIPEAAYQLEQILTGDEAADRIEAAYRHVIKHYQSEDTMAATESLLLSLLR